MTETPGTLLAKEFNLDRQRAKDFDQSLNRKLDLVLYAIVKRSFDDTIEKIKHRPPSNNPVLHNLIMQSNKRPTTIKSFKEFQTS